MRKAKQLQIGVVATLVSISLTLPPGAALAATGATLRSRLKASLHPTVCRSLRPQDGEIKIKSVVTFDKCERKVVDAATETNKYKWKQTENGRHRLYLPENCEFSSRKGDRYARLKCTENKHFSLIEFNIFAGKGEEEESIADRFEGRFLLPADGTEWIFEAKDLSIGDALSGGGNSLIMGAPVRGTPPSDSNCHYRWALASKILIAPNLNLPKKLPADGEAAINQGRLGKTVPLFQATKWLDGLKFADSKTQQFLNKRPKGAFKFSDGTVVSNETVARTLQGLASEIAVEMAKKPLQATGFTANNALANAIAAWGLYATLSDDSAITADKVSAYTGMSSAVVDAVTPLAKRVYAKFTAKSTGFILKAGGKVIPYAGAALGATSDGAALISSIKKGDKYGIAVDGSALAGSILSIKFPPAVVFFIPSIIDVLESIFTTPVPKLDDAGEMQRFFNDALTLFTQAAAYPSQHMITQIIALTGYGDALQSKLVSGEPKKSLRDRVKEVARAQGAEILNYMEKNPQIYGELFEKILDSWVDAATVGLSKQPLHDPWTKVKSSWSKVKSGQAYKDAFKKLIRTNQASTKGFSALISENKSHILGKWATDTEKVFSSSWPSN